MSSDIADKIIMKLICIYHAGQMIYGDSLKYSFWASDEPSLGSLLRASPFDAIKLIWN